MREHRAEILMQEAAQVETEVSGETFVAARGAMLGKYTLVQPLQTLPLNAGSSLLQDEQQSTEWPKELRPMEFRFGEDPKHLGKGSFGEVWEAHDKVTGDVVALKVFYKSSGHYMTWKNTNQAQQNALKLASVECELQHRFIEHKDLDPVGARHVTACIEDHVGPNEGTDRVCYLVLETGGENLQELLEKWQQAPWPPPDLEEHLRHARQIIVGIVQGLRFMQSFDPPIVHHDLKPDNVVWKLVDGRFIVQIIDFGGALAGTSEGHKEFTLTWNYAPMEVTHDKPGEVIAMVEPWHSYDIYSAGLIYLQLLCPMLAFDKNNIVPIINTEEAQKPEHIKKWVKSILPMCQFHEDELSLIASMLGPAEDRPSPTQVLANPILGHHVQDDASGLKAHVSTKDVLARLYDVSKMFHKKRMHKGFTKLKGDVKCCCHPQSRECKLVDTSDHPTCDRKRLATVSSVMVGHISGIWSHRSA
eukprot:gnl/TRDRNA2_/TRDRNA2_29520_c0_seq1.p1 gnl/TRDRNA2_/TRDRNA2_29520_c0~~gnl/TRDRNA2_/TRDRNA2_29520_c0_seq1.p1  ORF type:complete len:516 (-),score=99.09 gnl/TRDRNA2_/TRDRNA2_29520_c0_seq1:191-1612(-)